MRKIAHIADSKNKKAQAMTEYVMLLSAIVIGSGLAVTAFLQGVGDYYLNIVRVIGLPFP
ncbi:MAG: hypothetical protein ACYTFY_03335 [Planctomycetota bacterium]|jgi:hypothetical protein